jgi:DNA helicase-2/ATP-dependent DNA helicase PcrA
MKRENSTITEGLNAAQKEAVEEFEGPSLIIAGAGSGKTRVLTCRIANILKHGHRASSVLALTFTNKASREMKERITTMVGRDNARYLWMGTFHSVFIRFLREDAGLIGFPSAFTIYDKSDSRSAVRNCIRELNLDEKMYKPADVLSRISMAKNNLITPGAYLNNAALMQNDAVARKPRVGEIYALYHKRCKQAGAMDFDDILLYANILLRDFPEVLEKLQSRFSYILVDEYQDTNYAQYLIVKKLAMNHGNLCVVGDDAQSIYAFRGARIENILNFRKDFPAAREFRLEQNYRSTSTIVSAANSLIARNERQLKKECFSAAGEGDKIEVMKAYTDQEESFLVASSIFTKMFREKAAYKDFAVLYRTNAQSRAVEEALRKRGVPYRIYGGNSFYDRAEIKDLMAYMRLLVNPKDDEAFKRVVNVPARGIGATSVGYLSSAAASAELSLWEAFHTGDTESFGLKSAARNKIAAFCSMIGECASKVKSMNAYDVAMEVFISSGYATAIKSDSSVEGQSRAENVEELFNSLKSFVEEKEADYEADAGGGFFVDGTEGGTEGVSEGGPEGGPDGGSDGAFDSAGGSASGSSETEGPAYYLGDYLETISLMSAIDEGEGEDDNNKVSLMTVHSAKGLEFAYVYIIGMEENLFPSVNSSSSDAEIEEERRLMYVAITRAKKSVNLSYAQSRFRWGTQVNYPPSRFLSEIDKRYLDWPDAAAGMGIGGRQAGVPSGGSWGRSSGRSFGGSSGGSGEISSNGSSAASAPFRKKSSYTPPKPPNPNFQADPVSRLKKGQRVEHDRFGYGCILTIEGDPLNLKAVVEFDEGGKKVLLLKFAKLRVVE